MVLLDLSILGSLKFGVVRLINFKVITMLRVFFIIMKAFPFLVELLNQTCVRTTEIIDKNPT